jgi:acyl-CoA thioesterase YciA
VTEPAINQINPRGELSLRTLAMPADANPAGDIFGGWVMSQMDIGSALCAVERTKSRVVTVAVDRMNFIAPVHVGDVLCVYAEVDKVGRTSLNIHVEAWVLRDRQGERVQVTKGTFIFVALDDEGKPKTIQ